MLVILFYEYLNKFEVYTSNQWQQQSAQKHEQNLNLQCCNHNNDNYYDKIYMISLFMK